MLIRTLTRAAGRLNFAEGQELNLPKNEAQELLDCGAAVLVNPPEEKPKGKATTSPPATGKAKDKD